MLFRSNHLNTSIKSSPVTENSFKNSYQDWREGTFEKFKAWSLDQFGVNPKDSDDEAEVPVNMVKAKDIFFEKNRSGVFVLPPMATIKPSNRNKGL